MARTIVVTELGLHSLQRSPLSKVEGVILWHLAERLPITGSAVSKTQLGAALSIRDAHVSRTMKRLCELGFLTRGPKIGMSYHYKLNPAFFRILS
ncbi:winged helix DNA-binding protein [Thiobacillus sp.]|uniref:winged helix DNA-binding protein n=1 Tax=Thiobacillus sp. TaxID=924 RepID=UPI0025D7F676|nr:winged helix DNA-binding protein [Thiobacillus sp.]